MPRIHLLMLLASALASPLLAQDAPPTVAPCRYDLCSLRVEEYRILRGVQNTEVGRLGSWRATKLLPLMDQSDSAQFYARQFDENYAVGTRWTAVSGLALGIAAGFLLSSSHHAGEYWNGNDWAWVGALALSIGTGVYGERRVVVARRGLSRALWWHNRELAR
jgi:hypothetical protein